MDKTHLEVIIRQQPTKGRRCAFSEVHKGTTLSPSFILEVLTNQDTTNFHLFAKVSLCSDQYEDRSTVIAPGRSNSRQKENVARALPYDNLLGQKIAASINYIEPVTGKTQLLFLFHHLIVRVQGRYRLRCQVFDITKPFMEVIDIYTDVFQVYPPSDYPGQDAFTSLEKSLSKQGFKLYSRPTSRQ
jgi:hypothetical protein